MPKGETVPFSCTCGRVQGNIHDVAPNKGNHLKCYCRSCQTAAKVLAYEDSLDPHGGTDVFQTVPGKIEFTSGVDDLACLKLSPKGMLRWHCGSCNAPLFTMPEAAWFPIAGLNMSRVAGDQRAIFGPIQGVHQAQSAMSNDGHIRTYGIKRALLKLVWRALRARLRRDSQAPFFDRTGRVSVSPRVLSLEERRAASPK